MPPRTLTVRPALACGELLAEHDNGGHYQRCLPTIAGPRPAWMPRDLWHHFYETVHPPDARVVLLRHATIRGPGIITLPDGTLVAESLINCHHLETIADLRRDGPDRFTAPQDPPDGATLAGRHVILKQMWDVNYGHWLIESLPRVALLAGLPHLHQARYLVSGLDGMAPSVAPMRAVVTDSLARFGIRPDQILPCGWAPLTVQELVYPLPLTVQPWVKAPCIARILRTLAEPAPPRAAARLFVRRAQGASRVLLNAAQIEPILFARGYQPIDPASLSFADQVRGFAAASLVVGTLGAECANLAFAPPGVRFLGLAPEQMQDDFFYDLVSLKHGAYFSLHGTSTEGMNANFTIDPTLLAPMLNAMERGLAP